MVDRADVRRCTVKFRGWRNDVCYMRGVVIARHNVPIGDSRDHAPSAQCWCKPEEVEDCDRLFVHKSADGRELVENHEGTMH